MVRLRRDGGKQGLDALDGRAVGRDRDGGGAGAEVGEGIEGGAGRGAGGGFARGDEDFGCAGLEEAAEGGGYKGEYMDGREGKGREWLTQRRR